MNDARALTRLFESGLSLRPTTSQVEAFAADVARSSHEMLDAALRELAAAGVRDEAVTDVRAAVIAVYWRKLAEVTRLSPVFFVFETSFRAFVAARLAVVYGQEHWWRPVSDAVLGGRDPFRLSTLNGRAVSRSTIRTIAHVVRTSGTGSGPAPTSYGLVSAGTLAHVSQLICQHWGDMAAAFHPGHTLRAGGRFTRSEFEGLFNRVRTARNDAYHHRPVPAQARVVEIAEQLLDLLDISLDLACQRIVSAKVTDLRFGLPIQGRHG